MQAHLNKTVLIAGAGLALALTGQPASAATLVIDEFTHASDAQSLLSLWPNGSPVAVSASGLSGVLGGTRVVTVTRMDGTLRGNAFEIATNSTFSEDTGQAFLNLAIDARAKLVFSYPRVDISLLGYERIDVLWWADQVNLGVPTKMNLELTSSNAVTSIHHTFDNTPPFGKLGQLVTTSFQLSAFSGIIDLASVSAILLTYERGLASDTIFASISAKQLTPAGGTVVPLPAGVWLLAAGAMALFGLGVARSDSGATPTG